MIMKKLVSISIMCLSLTLGAQDKDERMQRDIEVAENVLSTLIKQQIERRSYIWPSANVRGSYTEGFGITLRVPFENFPLALTIPSGDGQTIWSPGADVVVEYDNNEIAERKMRREIEVAEKEKETLKTKKAAQQDSAREAFSDKLIDASKTFLADYGDLMNIAPNERILITTKSDRGRYNYVFAFSGDYKTPKHRVISVEATKSDLTQYKQGKITRDQLYKKFKVVNSEVNEESQPDLELLSTIFGRLYQSDLSKTYFVTSSPRYERMKDFGATFYMTVYSSNSQPPARHSMPTLGLSDLDQAERDKKATELYPLFEKELKDNMIEYGRTLSSLNDDETLIFEVAMTKCKGCGIPLSIEASVKASVLKDFGSGKINKDNAISKVSIKKGSTQ